MTIASRSSVAVVAGLVAVVIAACAPSAPSSPASSASCGSEIADGGGAAPIGTSGVSFEVPMGWTAAVGESEHSQSVVASSADQRFLVRVMAVAPEVAEMLPATDATVVGKREVGLANGRVVEADLITSEGKAGYRIIASIRTGAVEIEVLGAAVDCDASLADLLGRINLGP